MIWRILTGFLIVLILLLLVLHIRARGHRREEDITLATLPRTITLSSQSFPPGGDLPMACSCKGPGNSPALDWSSTTAGVRSYALLATDYDAVLARFPIFNFSHWVVYNLPPTVRSLPEGVTPEQMLLLGGKLGDNGMNEQRFVPPCPPFDRHRYTFRVYALDTTLSFNRIPDRQNLLDAMQGHILEYGELTGLFEK
ncbi:YbhB/YbcL family Raf kinase inhibitor-like protein [Spirosoma rhododendri]|nr:YbhB/YbcL family Raf kinase inhibitor-like protein [Spirosoma rhododendri]